MCILKHSKTPGSLGGGRTGWWAQRRVTVRHHRTIHTGVRHWDGASRAAGLDTADRTTADSADTWRRRRTHLVEVVLLPLFDLGVHVVHQVVPHLQVELTALVRLDQGRLPGRLRRPVLRTWQQHKQAYLSRPVLRTWQQHKQAYLSRTILRTWQQHKQAYLSRPVLRTWQQHKQAYLSRPVLRTWQQHKQAYLSRAVLRTWQQHKLAYLSRPVLRTWQQHKQAGT